MVHRLTKIIRFGSTFVNRNVVQCPIKMQRRYVMLMCVQNKTFVNRVRKTAKQIFVSTCIRQPWYHCNCLRVLFEKTIVPAFFSIYFTVNGWGLLTLMPRIAEQGDNKQGEKICRKFCLSDIFFFNFRVRFWDS